MLLRLVNWNGDFYDLEKKLIKTRDNATDHLEGRCSAQVKVAPNNADLFVSQVAMSGYQNMLRMLKLYKFGHVRSVANMDSSYSCHNWQEMLENGANCMLGIIREHTTISGIFGGRPLCTFGCAQDTWSGLLAINFNEMSEEQSSSMCSGIVGSLCCSIERLNCLHMRSTYTFLIRSSSDSP
ncbi:hypothetical protein KIN20_010389 [Parelaphostrongylus tenuis]|uniref:Phospholipase B-like n=1 Tax=Parelaphostrongylus tenuis TaxID=148309 RepID=A0AAD5QLT8_PARTN|nr:hypothetical protein KIN20_010389 [Parelaphostrongylus tenuis]